MATELRPPLSNWSTNRINRIKLLIQFDGTDYCGWAEQAKQKSILGTLKSCIKEISGETPDLRGCSRTDSGAHAIGMVADFSTDNPMESEKWAFVINRLLPDDIRVHESAETPMEFHSRFFARSREYVYRIALADKPEPFRARYVYGTWRKLELNSMQRAASFLNGTNDFRAFGEELVDLKNAVREVKKIDVTQTGDEIRLRVEATAFIRGMMRRIAGGLLEVGCGKRTVEDFRILTDLKRRDEVNWPVVLPAKGLTLVKAKYGRTLRDYRELVAESDE
ncbi:MAG: tRNA pseudouridine(38-40) synthase TruA [Fimbriimonadales bacterium]